MLLRVRDSGVNICDVGSVVELLLHWGPYEAMRPEARHGFLKTEEFKAMSRKYRELAGLILSIIGACCSAFI